MCYIVDYLIAMIDRLQLNPSLGAFKSSLCDPANKYHVHIRNRVT